MSKINLQELQRNCNATANFVNLIMTSTVQSKPPLTDLDQLMQWLLTQELAVYNQLFQLAVTYTLGRLFCRLLLLGGGALAGGRFPHCEVGVEGAEHAGFQPLVGLALLLDQADLAGRVHKVLHLNNKSPHTVESRYLKLGYLEFCETRSVYLNQKYSLIAFSNHNLALETFLRVQITRSANSFALRVIWTCKK